MNFSNFFEPNFFNVENLKQQKTTKKHDIRMFATEIRKKIDFERQFLKKSVLAGILLGFCWDAGISLGFLLGSCWYSYPSIPAPTEPLDDDDANGDGADKEGSSFAKWFMALVMLGL